MARLLITHDDVIAGPVILDIEKLETLDSLLVRIQGFLNKAYSRKVREIESAPNLEPWEELQLDQISPPVCRVELHGNDKRTLVDENIRNIVKDVKSKDITVNELVIEIGDISENEFSLHIFMGRGGKINYKFRSFYDEISEDIKYDVEKWLDSVRPKVPLKYWEEGLSLVRGLCGIIGFIYLVSIWPNGNTIDRAESYKKELKREAAEVLKNGVSGESQGRALEIILELETGHVPSEYVQPPPKADEFNFKDNNQTLLFLLCSGLLCICPETCINVGRSKWKVRVYQIWLRFIIWIASALFGMGIIYPKFLSILHQQLGI